MPNPFVAQGTLNRLKAAVTIANFPNLNITSAYMGKSFITVSFDDDFDNLIPTATGAVTSPEPYVMATVTIPVLKTQALSGAWVAQYQSSSDIGNISIFPDVNTSTYPEIDLVNCIIKNAPPGAFDGTDPVVMLTLRGTYYINNALWSA
jgi:hypothetical protein